MPFRKIVVQWSAGENVPPANVPQALKLYCKAMQDIPPSSEQFVGDSEYDLGTLHSSAGFRDYAARLAVALAGKKAKLTAANYSELVVNWGNPSQHEISADGKKWTSAPGLALKYEVTYTPQRGRTQTVYMGIQFGN